MASKTLRNLRQQAAQTQGWLCFYCELPMWEGSPRSFVAQFGIPRGLAKRFQCTAEHLNARCDGGEDVEPNIVAACLHCNLTRHKAKRPRDPAEHAALVRQRLASGRWHPPMVRDALTGNGKPLG